MFNSPMTEPDQAITRLLTYLRNHHRAWTDTRTIRPGDIFFALKGPRFNGNGYATEALARGASLAVIDQPSAAIPGDDRYLVVSDALRTLQDAALAWRRTFSIPVIGLTGSNGKTTTKELLAAALQTEKRVHATAGNFNNHIGVPLTLLAMPQIAEMAVIEMGTNMPGDIAQLTLIAEPTHTLITNVGEAHLERLGSLDGVRKEKGAVYDWVRHRGGVAFVNETDARVVAAAEGNLQRITYGGPNSNYAFDIVEESLDGMRLRFRAKHWVTPLEIKTQLAGAYNAINVAAAVAIADFFGISHAAIQAGIFSYRPANQRSQLIRQEGRSIWMDAYNANPSSMRAAIGHALSAKARRPVLILGDMLELGENEQEAHADLGRWINGQGPCLTIAIGPRMRCLAEALKSPVHWRPNAAEALPLLREWLADADFVLLKGSRSMQLELLLPAITTGE